MALTVGSIALMTRRPTVDTDSAKGAAAALVHQEPHSDEHAVRVPVPRGGTLRIMDPQGMALPDASVVWRLDNSLSSIVGESDADGIISLRMTPDEKSATLEVSRPGFTSVSLGKTELPADGSSKEIVLAGHLAIKISDLDSNMPIAGMEIRLRNPNCSDDCFSAVSDGSGIARFVGLADLPYTAICADGWIACSPEVPVFMPQDELVDISVVRVYIAMVKIVGDDIQTFSHHISNGWTSKLFVGAIQRLRNELSSRWDTDLIAVCASRAARESPIAHWSVLGQNIGWHAKSVLMVPFDSRIAPEIWDWTTFEKAQKGILRLLWPSEIDAEYLTPTLLEGDRMPPDKVIAIKARENNSIVPGAYRLDTGDKLLNSMLVNRRVEIEPGVTTELVLQLRRPVRQIEIVARSHGIPLETPIESGRVILVDRELRHAPQSRFFENASRVKVWAYDGIFTLRFFAKGFDRSECVIEVGASSTSFSVDLLSR